MWIVIPFTFGLGAALLLKGGVWPHQWNWIALLIAVTSLAWHLTFARTRPRKQPVTPVEILVLALGVYPLLQLIPLPVSFVQWASPERYQASVSAAAALGWPGPESIPLSLAPGRTFQVWLSLAPAVVVFLTLRSLCQHIETSRWRLVVPIIALATLEAILGIAQWWLGQGAGIRTIASGTFVNRNHFAGLLEMATPLALCAAAAAWSASVTRHSRPASAGLKAGALLILPTIMMAAIVLSLSRMGFIATLAGMLVAGLCAVTWMQRSRGAQFWTRVTPAAGVLCAVLILGFVLPTEALIQRFGSFASGELSPAARSLIWRNTLPLISTYRWTGCGLGAYESGLLKWRTAAPMNTVDYAHNDYLQILAELGIPGFVLALSAAAVVLWILIQTARRQRRDSDWWLSIGLIASLSAIAIHSLSDFNLYIPSNLMTVAWLSGVAVGGARDQQTGHVRAGGFGAVRMQST